MKVKVYTQDTYNEIADKLAKTTRNDDIFNLKNKSNDIIRSIYLYKGKVMNISAREFAKAQVKARAGQRWMNLNCFNKIMDKDKSKEQ